jgi:hypothetical protein
MKKQIEQILQESVKIGHLGSLKGIELLKIWCWGSYNLSQ